MFEIGDKVKWSSNGYTKYGIVFEIIPPGQPILESWQPHIVDGKYRDKFSEYNISKLGSTSSRNHESYVIRVDKYLYWPRVSLLCKIEKEDNVS